MTVLYGLPNEEYRAMEGLSQSECKVLARSPAHFRWMKDHPEDSASSSFAFGQMTHCATLEPHAFDSRYTMGPSVSKSTKEWREFVQYCSLQGTLPCTAEDREAAFSCAVSVLTHPEVAPLMADGKPEVSFFWRDRVTGIDCKGRIDWVHQQGQRAWVLDLKTTDDAGKQSFKRSVVNYAYHRQADWYEDGFAQASGLIVSPMLFVVVEKTPPYACAAYTLHPRFMKQARKTNNQLRAIYAHCLKTDTWPGYDPAITDLDAPLYALDDELREEAMREMREERMTA